MNFFSYKWNGRVLASPFLVLQLFDFFYFCCLLLIEKGAQKIGKSCCEIRGRGTWILAFFMRKLKVQQFRKNEFFTFKWIGSSGVSFSCFATFWFFYFLASFVEKTEGAKNWKVKFRNKRRRQSSPYTTYFRISIKQFMYRVFYIFIKSCSFVYLKNYPFMFIVYSYYSSL